MVIIYSEKAGSRLDYVLNEIFAQRLGIAYELTHSIEEFENADNDVRINYSSRNLPGHKVEPEGLLFETDPRLVFPDFVLHKELLLLFPSANGFACDIFSMAFWLLSRCEEYAPHHRDKHDRFLPDHVWPPQFADKPILDQALQHFFTSLGLAAPDKFAIYPTIDVDIAFKHKGRGFLRWFGGLMRMLFKGNFRYASERISVLFGAHDPNDTFNYLSEKLQAFQKNTRFFIQVSSPGIYDKNIPLTNKEFSNIVLQIARDFETGIHPGYQMGTNAHGISAEKKFLENHIQKKITRSRHHFLRIKLPQTYQDLLKAGITHDYSMGYAGELGFRAGTAQSFRFFDLGLNQVTELVIHPFCAMDVSLKNYLKLSVEEAVLRVREQKQICRAAKTPFCFIFHNESLSNCGEWEGWTKVFEECIK